MAFSDAETEHLGQEIVTDEHHDQDEVIDDSINIEVLNLRSYFSKLILEIFSQDAHDNILKLNLRYLSDGSISLVFRPGKFLSNDGNVF